jgi:hypothetical protein
MARTILTGLAVIVALLGAIYQLHFKPVLKTAGLGRVIKEVGNKHCKTVPELQACEKIVLHQRTGILYLACSTPYSRTQWSLLASQFNVSGRSHDDYVATYDPKNSRITRLALSGLPQGLSVHGMDVVPSDANSKDLFVYLVNHQPPVGKDPVKFGANSTIEIFKTRVGASTLTHLHTVHDPVLVTPNDIVGSSDGKSFYFTNTISAKASYMKLVVNTLLRRSIGSVGYCHVDEGCKFAAPKIPEANGIASVNDTFYVASSVQGTVTALERQNDNSLVLTDVIPTDMVLDNLSIDEDGMIWAAGIPDFFKFLTHMDNPSVLAPSSALRVSLNTGEGVFYGHKYKVEKVFEDHGDIASGSTSAVHDSKRGWLFLHGWSSPHLVVCQL